MNHKLKRKIKAVRNILDRTFVIVLSALIFTVLLLLGTIATAIEAISEATTKSHE